ncbi:hypothetical protein, partial [Mesorhizobium japonicum]|uniref:hypothetical protein n=1 Tax=Mesorhizobium japonicum TaxID=2066070 RepID=UPI003B5A34AC
MGRLMIVLAAILSLCLKSLAVDYASAYRRALGLLAILERKWLRRCHDRSALFADLELGVLDRTV